MTAPSWDRYLRTIVDLNLSLDEAIRIHPAPPGEIGAWPDPLPPTLHILTAWNPGANPLPTAVNRERQRTLEAELADRHVATWKAIGHDPDSAYFEEGVALHGLDEEEVIALARHHDQEAIFSWTPSAWTTVSCEDRSRIALGWWIETLRSRQPDVDASDRSSRR